MGIPLKARRPLRKKKAFDPARQPAVKYRPTSHDGFGSFWGPGQRAALDGLPPFTYYDIPRMIWDPDIVFGLEMRAAMVLQGGWEVECDDADAKAWIDRTVKVVWTRILPRMMPQYFRWGSACALPTYESDGGFVDITGGRMVTPMAGTPHLWTEGECNGQFYGIDLAGLDGSAAGRVVETPWAMWYGGLEKRAPLYDRSLLAEAWVPWLEKMTRGGALDTRRTYYRRSASPPQVWTVPLGLTDPADENSISWMDWAAKLAETSENNSILLVPDMRVPGIDGRSESQWKFDAVVAGGNAADMLEYVNTLRKEIFRGFALPPEVMEAMDGGSGYSGRQIPQQALYAITDQLVMAAVDMISHCVLRELVPHNFGDGVKWRVTAVGLMETIQRKQQQGDIAPGDGDPVEQALAQVQGGGGGEDAMAGTAPSLPGGDRTASNLVPYVGPEGGHGMQNPVTKRVYYDKPGANLSHAPGGVQSLWPSEDEMRLALFGPALLSNQPGTTGDDDDDDLAKRTGPRPGTPVAPAKPASATPAPAKKAAAKAEPAASPGAKPAAGPKPTGSTSSATAPKAAAKPKPEPKPASAVGAKAAAPAMPAAKIDRPAATPQQKKVIDGIVAQHRGNPKGLTDTITASLAGLFGENPDRKWRDDPAHAARMEHFFHAHDAVHGEPHPQEGAFRTKLAQLKAEGGGRTRAKPPSAPATQGVQPTSQPGLTPPAAGPSGSPAQPAQAPATPAKPAEPKPVPPVGSTNVPAAQWSPRGNRAGQGGDVGQDGAGTAPAEADVPLDPKGDALAGPDKGFVPQPVQSVKARDVVGLFGEHGGAKAAQVIGDRVAKAKASGQAVTMSAPDPVTGEVKKVPVSGVEGRFVIGEGGERYDIWQWPKQKWSLETDPNEYVPKNPPAEIGGTGAPPEPPIPMQPPGAETPAAPDKPPSKMSPPIAFAGDESTIPVAERLGGYLDDVDASGKSAAAVMRDRAAAKGVQLPDEKLLKEQIGRHMAELTDAMLAQPDGQRTIQQRDVTLSDGQQVVVSVEPNGAGGKVRVRLKKSAVPLAGGAPQNGTPPAPPPQQPPQPPEPAAAAEQPVAQNQPQPAPQSAPADPVGSDGGQQPAPASQPDVPAETPPVTQGVSDGDGQQGQVGGEAAGQTAGEGGGQGVLPGQGEGQAQGRVGGEGQDQGEGQVAQEVTPEVTPVPTAPEGVADVPPGAGPATPPAEPAHPAADPAKRASLATQYAHETDPVIRKVLGEELKRAVGGQAAPETTAPAEASAPAPVEAPVTPDQPAVPAEAPVPAEASAPAEVPAATKALADRVVSRLAMSSVPEHMRGQYEDAARTVVGRMPDGVVSHLAATLKHTSFHGTPESVGTAILAGDYGDRIRRNNPEMYEALRTNRVRAAGSYDPVEARLYLNGPGGTKRDAFGSVPSHGQTYAHEFGHVIDHRGRFNRTPEWQRFHQWLDEQKAVGDFPLGEYAPSNSFESFAEFSRLVYSGEYDMAEVERRFPTAADFFKANGLWPAGGGTSAPESLPDIYDPDTRIDLGANGAHVDVYRDDDRDDVISQPDPAGAATGGDRPASQGEPSPAKAPVEPQPPPVAVPAGATAGAAGGSGANWQDTSVPPAAQPSAAAPNPSQRGDRLPGGGSRNADLYEKLVMVEDDEDDLRRQLVRGELTPEQHRLRQAGLEDRTRDIMRQMAERRKSGGEAVAPETPRAESPPVPVPPTTPPASAPEPKTAPAKPPEYDPDRDGRPIGGTMKGKYDTAEQADAARANFPGSEVRESKINGFYLVYPGGVHPPAPSPFVPPGPPPAKPAPVAAETKQDDGPVPERPPLIVPESAGGKKPKAPPKPKPVVPTTTRAWSQKQRDAVDAAERDVLAAVSGGMTPADAVAFFAGRFTPEQVRKVLDGGTNVPPPKAAKPRGGNSEILRLSGAAVTPDIVSSSAATDDFDGNLDGPVGEPASATPPADDDFVGELNEDFRPGEADDQPADPEVLSGHEVAVRAAGGNLTKGRAVKSASVVALRKRSGLTGREFDDAVLRMAERGEVRLHPAAVKGRFAADGEIGPHGAVTDEHGNVYSSVSFEGELPGGDEPDDADGGGGGGGGGGSPSGPPASSGSSPGPRRSLRDAVAGKGKPAIAADPAYTPDAEPAGSKSANPKAADAPKAIEDTPAAIYSAVQSAAGAASGRAKTALEAALENASGYESESPRNAKRTIVRRLVSAANQLRYQGLDGDAAEVDRVLEAIPGVRRVGEAGGQAAFDSKDHDAPVGMGFGTAVTVGTPGYRIDEGDGRTYTVERADVRHSDPEEAAAAERYRLANEKLSMEMFGKLPDDLRPEQQEAVETAARRRAGITQEDDDAEFERMFGDVPPPGESVAAPPIDDLFEDVPPAAPQTPTVAAEAEDEGAEGQKSEPDETPATPPPVAAKPFASPGEGYPAGPWADVKDDGKTRRLNAAGKAAVERYLQDFPNGLVGYAMSAKDIGAMVPAALEALVAGGNRHNRDAASGDLDDALKMAVVQAAATFDPAKGKFEGHVFGAMRKAVSDIVEKHATKKRGKGRTQSESKPLPSGEMGSHFDDSPAREKSPDEIAEEAERGKKIAAALEAAVPDERDREVVRLFHGLEGRPKKKQAEIAKVVRLSQSMVSQILARVHKVLRDPLRSLAPPGTEGDDGNDPAKRVEASFVPDDPAILDMLRRYFPKERRQ